MMKPEKESFSFGYYLQSIRLEKNITLETVAEETRIAISNLILIEKEDVESLPNPVFVKGFLRSYAQAIGANGEEAVRLYEAKLDMKNRFDDTTRISPKFKLSPWRNLILSIVAVVGLIAMSLYGVSYFQHRTTHSDKTETAGPGELAPEAHATDPNTSAAKNKIPSATLTKKVLHIRALEDTWVKIIVDNPEPKEYNLRSGDQLDEEATVGYNLLIGNAIGLELKLDGKPVNISGKAGEVVNIQIP